MSRSIRSAGILAGLLGILYITGSNTGPGGTTRTVTFVPPPSESYVVSTADPGLLLSEAQLQPRTAKKSDDTTPSITNYSSMSTLSPRGKNALSSTESTKEVVVHRQPQCRGLVDRRR